MNNTFNSTPPSSSICHHIRMVLFCFIFMVIQSCDSLTHILQGCLIALGCPSANEVTLKGMSKLGDTRSQWPFFHLGQQSIQSKMHKKISDTLFSQQMVFSKDKVFPMYKKKIYEKIHSKNYVKYDVLHLNAQKDSLCFELYIGIFQGPMS